MKLKRIIIAVVVVVIVVLIALVAKYSVIDVKWSVSPYSETRHYLCTNTINDGRAADIAVGFYENNSSIFLYPDTYIPAKHHASGDMVQVSDISGIKTYQGNGDELIIDGHKVTLKEKGNVVLDKCEQKMPGV